MKETVLHACCVLESALTCIYIEGHKELTTTTRGRKQTVNALDRFDIDYSVCSVAFVRVCPFDALFGHPNTIFRTEIS